MFANPRSFVESVDIDPLAITEQTALEGPGTSPLNLNKLPDGVVSGQTLIDFSAVPFPDVRAGISLSMLLASRAASKKVDRLAEGNEDEWLAEYTNSLHNLGFTITPASVIKSQFKKFGIDVHQAIIPFLTIAFGATAIGPIILAALQHLQEIDKDKPWITLFETEAKRFSVTEFHFAAASSTALDTSIRYAIARLTANAQVTSVLFFKISAANATFESQTTTMSANNSLMAVMEDDLKNKLGLLAKKYIAEISI